MGRKSSDGMFLFYVILGLILLLVMCGLIGLEIYVWVHYAGMPLEEIPIWALWLMFRS